MRKDNKLGKEKQKNKQIISRPVFSLLMPPPFFAPRRMVASRYMQSSCLSDAELAHDYDLCLKSKGGLVNGEIVD